jgi:hypothetical protein
LGALLSRLIRLQPLGAVIETFPERRAWTDATSTSPLAVVAGRGTVSVDPNVVAVTTPPPDGRALSARPDPEMATPRTSASTRNGT